MISMKRRKVGSVGTQPTFTEYHANVIAKEIRELFPTYDPQNEAMVGAKSINMAQRGILSALALSLAHRFKEEHPNVDYMRFLEHCSPDNDRFPITELWEEEDEEDS